VSGPRLESRWLEGAWRTTRDGEALGGTPFESLAAIAEGSRAPLLGALSFELACWEAGLPHSGPPQGALGMVWTEVREALSLDATGAEALGWDRSTVERAPWVWPDDGLARGQAGPLVPAWTSGRHRQEVEAIRHRILDGDFYVANLCVPFEARVEGDALAFALDALRRASPPFGAVLDLGDRVLLSLSMERLLSLEAGRLRCEPIKGTCPRTGDPALDAAAALRLGSDPKERAEHTMIVDLVRNDLGRVARTGSVEVTASMAVRPYGTVQHLVSAVEADLAPGAGLAGILRAVLPGGSVTGAPKHAVCRHLAVVEAGPRGFYCGALGWIGAGGRAFDLAMPIRTAELRAGILTYWAGGGITRLSDPEEEWAEVLLKARAITG
jgi:anthranilate/para-aminobenzoate synthase component I